ncbi:hypothetical protein MTO96_024819 [Rhipicephalus appendiculatus]
MVHAPCVGPGKRRPPPHPDAFQAASGISLSLGPTLRRARPSSGVAVLPGGAVDGTAPLRVYCPPRAGDFSLRQVGACADACHPPRRAGFGLGRMALVARFSCSLACEWRLQESPVASDGVELNPS